MSIGMPDRVARAKRGEGERRGFEAKKYEMMDDIPPFYNIDRFRFRFR